MQRYDWTGGVGMVEYDHGEYVRADEALARIAELEAWKREASAAMGSDAWLPEELAKMHEQLDARDARMAELEAQVAAVMSADAKAALHAAAREEAAWLAAWGAEWRAQAWFMLWGRGAGRLAVKSALLERAEAAIDAAIGTAGEPHNGCRCVDDWAATLAAIREAKEETRR